MPWDIAQSAFGRFFHGFKKCGSQSLLAKGATGTLTFGRRGSLLQNWDAFQPD
jgi:hypothetical protein